VSHSFDPDIKRFVDAKGNAVPRGVVRDEIRKLTSHVSKEGAKISKAFQAGDIALPEFQNKMAELLKAGHIAAAAVGRGGIDRMSKADWGKVGNKIAWQNKYLERFANKINAGAVSPAMTKYRAGLYSSALWTTYNQTMTETMKEESSLGKNPEQCMLVTNSAEGCDECAADEAIGWMSVDDMGEIGSRLCGDFCRCEIIFENDDLNIDDFEIKMDLDLSLPTDEIMAAMDAVEPGGVVSVNPNLTARERFQLRTKIKKANAGIEREVAKLDAGDLKAKARLVGLAEKRAKYISELEGIPTELVRPHPLLVPPPPPPPPVIPPPVPPPPAPQPVGVTQLTARQRFQVRQQIKKVEVRISKLEQEVAAGKKHLQKSLDAARQKREDLLTKLSGKPPAVQSANVSNVKFEIKAGETYADAYLRTIKEMESYGQDPVRIVAAEEKIEAARKVHDAHKLKMDALQWGTPEHTEMRKQYWDLVTKIDDAKRELRMMTQSTKLDMNKLRDLIAVNDPAVMSANNISMSALTPGGKNIVQQGLNEINKLVSREMLADYNGGYSIKFTGQPGVRAHYSFQEHRVTFNPRGRDETRTIVHEIAHSFENKRSDVLRMANEFLDYRAKGEKPELLSKLTGNKGYRDTEIARADKFHSPYVGKQYGPLGRQYATEVMSMGFEELYANPAGFAAADPEYFNFITRIARGEKFEKGTIESWLKQKATPTAHVPEPPPLLRAPHPSGINPSIPDVIKDINHKVDTDFSQLRRELSDRLAKRSGLHGTDAKYDYWVNARGAKDMMGLSKDEYNLIYNYTNEGDRMLNYRHHQYRFKDLTSTEMQRIDKWRADLKFVLETKVKKFEGAVWRGEKFRGELENLRVRGQFFLDNQGQTYVLEDFTSTTHNKSVTSRFGGEVVFEILSKTGAAFDRMPLPYNEAEVLFSPGKKFKIVKATKFGDTFHVKLEEIIP
jgi:hypothetical protein